MEETDSEFLFEQLPLKVELEEYENCESGNRITLSDDRKFSEDVNVVNGLNSNLCRALQKHDGTDLNEQVPNVKPKTELRTDCDISNQQDVTSLFENSYAFSSQQDNVDIRKDTGEHSFSSEACESNTSVERNKINMEVGSPSGGLPYECNICYKTFPEMNNLIEHSSTHVYTCEVCGKMFVNNKHGFYRHMLSHGEECSYVCEICKKAFLSKNGLAVHMRTFSGACSCTCKICNKTYRDKHSLSRHMRSHTGERPFECDICNKSFSRKDQLIQHSLVHRI